MKNSYDNLSTWLKNYNKTLNFIDFRGFRRFKNHFVRRLMSFKKSLRKKMVQYKF